MKTIQFKSLLAVALAFTVSACNYSNEFTGTYNSAPAKLSAYSKNINTYCVALSLESNGIKKSNFISAQAVFDPNDLLAPKNFNTKGSQCAANQSEYLVGTRSATVLATNQVAQTRSVGAYDCQVVYYKQYQYQEKITFQIQNNADDAIVGTFDGVGQSAQYIDDAHPVGYGPIYQCRPYPQPYPRPYPGPGPYPRPYPGPGPYPHPVPHPHPRPFGV
jgi:hypothetical protein